MKLDLSSNKTIRKSVPFTSHLFFFARRVYLLHIQISVLPSLKTWIHSSAFELGIFVITAYHIATPFVHEGREEVLSLDQSDFIWDFCTLLHLCRTDSAAGALFTAVSRSHIVQVFSASSPYCPTSGGVIYLPFQLFMLRMCVYEKECANLYDMQEFADESCAISINIVSKMCHAVQ